VSSVVVWADPPADAQYGLLIHARNVARAHPGVHELRIRAAGRVLTVGERVALTREVIAELESLGFTVGVGVET